MPKFTTMNSAQPLIWIIAFTCIALSCEHEQADSVQTMALADRDSSFEDSTLVTDEPLTDTSEVVRVPWNELIGQFEPAEHPDFERISSRYTSKPDIYLRREALQAFDQMHEHASRDGVELSILSATRNWNYQRMLWERKWDSPRFMGFEPLQRAEQILAYSAMPGASRHHWGTDIDLNSLENDWFESETGLELYRWLQTHAKDYGFHQVYGPQTDGRTGYREEKWHWSYMPLASLYLDEMTRYHRDTLVTHFSGFSGAEWSEELHIFEEFIQGIAPMD